MGKFRKVFLPESELAARAPAWADRLKPVHAAWTSGALSEAETAAAYLIVSLQFWFPRRWLSGQDELGTARSESPSQPLGPWLEAHSNSKFPADWDLQTLVERQGFRGVRRDARQALGRWLAGEIRLRLTASVPTPQDVLHIQIQGERWVTVLFAEPELAGLVHDGRDALSFLLHDLGHAQKFFSSEFEPRAQIGCYRLLLEALQAGKFARLAELDARWEDRLHYLIADLNSHPAHILSVFWALAREAFLSGDRRADFEPWREEIYDLWQWPTALRQASEEFLHRQTSAAAVILSSALKNSAQPTVQYGS